MSYRLKQKILLQDRIVTKAEYMTVKQMHATTDSKKIHSSNKYKTPTNVYQIIL